MPIVSPLDNDLYAWTMGQVIWERFADWEVAYQFKNRHKVMRLPTYVNQDALTEDLNNLRYLTYTDKEIQVLRDQKIFSEGYLSFLKSMRLPEVDVQRIGDELSIEYVDLWDSAIFMESPLLATVEEHYVKGWLKANDISYGEATRVGQRNLNGKIDLWKQYPEIKIIDMATRRRFPGARYSNEWHERVLSHLVAEMSDQLIASSNPDLAHLFGIPMVGTMAHQMFMVVAAKFLAHPHGVNPLVDAQNFVFDLWEAQYGHVDNGRMLIALPDTFGTSFTLSHFGAERAQRWQGFRQDSGDPIVEGNRLYLYYVNNDIAPVEKTVIHSDSLNPEMTVKLHKRYGNGGWKHPFGIGGNIGNDCGVPTLPIVAKPAFVDGLPCRKLSDDPAKANANDDITNRYRELAKWRG